MNALEFDRLVQKYQSLVYTICRQLVADEGYAQDLTQETFLSAWRSMDRCPAGYEKQWLARIASNKAKDYLRSAWARRVNTPGDDVLALEGASSLCESPTRRPAVSCCWNSTPPPKPPGSAAGPRKQWRRRSSGQKRCWPRS